MLEDLDSPLSEESWDSSNMKYQKWNLQSVSNFGKESNHFKDQESEIKKIKLKQEERK